ncbi:MAG TPA: hypothetical protein VGO92_08475 [Acidimicrobiales bacterium]|nr:hypothetical protein [Acidimicrobiales bacterium]
METRTYRIAARLPIEELLVGIAVGRRRVELNTTAYWYYRACRAAVAGGGGYLSGLPASEQERAILSLLELRGDIGLPAPRVTVPVMAEVARRYSQLNLLNLEVVAAARILDAAVWLSVPAAAGVLPEVLDAEGLPWETVEIG